MTDAIVLAEGAAGSVEDWVAAMNAKAREIGMADSHFGNPNGWMDDGKTFVTARDLARWRRPWSARHPSKYRHFVGMKELSYNGISQRNHDPISGTVRGADGIKTGYTNQAGFGFLGSAQRDGQRLVMVIGGKPGRRERRDASRQFIEWGFANFESRLLFPESARIGSQASSRAGRMRSASSLVVRCASRCREARIPTSRSLSYEGPLQRAHRQG